MRIKAVGYITLLPMKLVRVVRNVEFSRLFDSFFISAVATILLVRFYLIVTGFPQIGGSTLHISHLLPGTLLLLAAVIVMLAAVNRAARDFAAIIAGIGSGFNLSNIRSAVLIGAVGKPKKIISR
jgi:hypothetical protein